MKETKRKVIFCANTSWYLWNFRSNLMDYLKAQGWEIHTIAPMDAFTPQLQAKYYYHPIRNLQRKGKNPFKDVLLLKEYISLYRKIRPSVVLSFTIKPNIYSSLACRFLNIPAISTITGLGYLFTEKKVTPFLSLLYRFGLSKNKAVVFQNVDDRELLTQHRIIIKEQAALIEGAGVDTNYFSRPSSPLEEERYTFLLSARMLKDKGVIEFIRAAHLIHKSYPEVTFALAGPIDTENPAAVSLDTLAFNEPWIIYLGEVKDVRPLLSASSVAVLPSYREGLPKGLLEAMAMELPIITTDAPGCRALVAEGANGILVPIRNAEALADAMKQLLRLSPAELSAMGKRGRALVLKRFDSRIVTAQYEALITANNA